MAAAEVPTSRRVPLSADRVRTAVSAAANHACHSGHNGRPLAGASSSLAAADRVAVGPASVVAPPLPAPPVLGWTPYQEAHVAAACSRGADATAQAAPSSTKVVDGLPAEGITEEVWNHLHSSTIRLVERGEELRQVATALRVRQARVPNKVVTQDGAKAEGAIASQRFETPSSVEMPASIPTSLAPAVGSSTATPQECESADRLMTTSAQSCSKSPLSNCSKSRTKGIAPESPRSAQLVHAALLRAIIDCGSQPGQAPLAGPAARAAATRRVRQLLRCSDAIHENAVQEAFAGLGPEAAAKAVEALHGTDSGGCSTYISLAALVWQLIGGETSDAPHPRTMGTGSDIQRGCMVFPRGGG